MISIIEQPSKRMNPTMSRSVEYILVSNSFLLLALDIIVITMEPMIERPSTMASMWRHSINMWIMFKKWKAEVTIMKPTSTIKKILQSSRCLVCLEDMTKPALTAGMEKREKYSKKLAMLA